ncbi:hypothetical protein FGM00_16455 [Aggregatimonas sangjinii]|uniref:SCP domain-containing protein n=1 Tax=Aggregatimonas sangjinii TaxID=2583587 RepID=A0A5B7SS67_9FLAO|nr:CAP domain-containing protein [Aggregatimonas sangjinii]QCX01625.1 hypothetical protein FGM00_16455 [Aggregatimonas sangjinii]
MRTLQFPLLLLSTFFVLTSCSKDSDVSEQQQEIEQETNDSARLSAKNLYQDYYVASRFESSDSPWAGDESACDPGTVPQDVRAKIFTRLSYFRKAVGLHNEISENATKSEKAQRAALMMQVNNTLDHFPPNSWRCFSPEGKEGAGNSLLTTARNAEAIDSYMRDAGSANGPVGHRRWLLWPNLQEIGIGNTNQANAVWVLGNAGTPPADAPEFVAWPPKGYAPKQLVYPRWSFSLKGADFTDATVSMTDSDGSTISLTIEELNTQFGDRTIVWVPEGVQTNITEDTAYTVTVNNVTVDGETRDFTYAVIIFDPSE